MITKSFNQNKIQLNQQTTNLEQTKQEKFADYIKEKRKEIISPSGKKRLKTRELAESLDINYEQFRKILNMNKPTKKRDCIIAICAILRLDIDDTNKALKLYQYMPILNEKNPRDELLIEILDKQYK